MPIKHLNNYKPVTIKIRKEHTKQHVRQKTTCAKYYKPHPRQWVGAVKKVIKNNSAQKALEVYSDGILQNKTISKNNNSKINK